ncbi:Uncharacterized protein GBIM_12859 [Gryllus bimaculatus]|nr:Uncharacterized protein GBIM_12859 [Gryllus bimaculatus]
MYSDHVREFSCGKMYYRTFYLDERRDSLYVGAMDRVYRLNLSNISHSNCERDSMSLEPSDVANCVSKGKSEHFDCRNHIRVIQPMGDGGRLYICGTNAHSPKDWVIYHVVSVSSGIATSYPPRHYPYDILAYKPSPPLSRLHTTLAVHPPSHPSLPPRPHRFHHRPLAAGLCGHRRGRRQRRRLRRRPARFVALSAAGVRSPPPLEAAWRASARRQRLAADLDARPPLVDASSITLGARGRPGRCLALAPPSRLPPRLAAASPRRVRAWRADPLRH